jgi:hypothetical protein
MEESLDGSLGQSDDQKSVDDIIRDGFKFEFEKYFNVGMKLWSKDAGNSILYTLLAGFILFASTFTIIGVILLPMPLAAGYFIAADKVKKRGSATLSDYFGGFNYFGKLTGFTGIILAIGIAFYLPIFLIMFAEFPFWEFAQHPNHFSEREVFEFFMGAFLGIIGFSIMATVVGAFLISIWIFVIPLIVLGNHSTMDALKYSYKIVMKQFWWFLLLSIILYLLKNAGAYALFVGVLATIPMATYVKYGAYVTITGGGTSTEDDL